VAQAQVVVRSELATLREEAAAAGAARREAEAGCEGVRRELEEVRAQRSGRSTDRNASLN
jgi:hypothetical protein